MAWAQGYHTIRASIVEKDEAAGWVIYRRSNRRTAERFESGNVRLDTVVRHLSVSFAGPEAQRRAMGRYHSYGAGRIATIPHPEHGRVGLLTPGSDLDHSADWIVYVCGADAEAQGLFSRWVHARVRASLAAPHWWACVEGVAEALMERHTLSRGEVRELVHGILLAQSAKRGKRP